MKVQVQRTRENETELKYTENREEGRRKVKQSLLAGSKMNVPLIRESMKQCLLLLLQEKEKVKEGRREKVIQWRRERERACDDCVLSQIGLKDQRKYEESYLHLATQINKGGRDGGKQVMPLIPIKRCIWVRKRKRSTEKSDEYKCTRARVSNEVRHTREIEREREGGRETR